MTSDDNEVERAKIDAMIAANIHQIERALNLAIQQASHEGLDVSCRSVDISTIGHGTCEITHVTVRRRI